MKQNNMTGLLVSFIIPTGYGHVYQERVTRVSEN